LFAPYPVVAVSVWVETDVIVIGAGAAGLAAACELGQRGLDVVVLEARDRMGGRILSLSPRGVRVPVELGAEFVHGESPMLRTLLKRAGVRLNAVPPRMWWRTAGELRLVPDFWERIGTVAGKVPAQNRGWSFAEFLRRQGAKITPEDRAMVEHYVGGFNAGPLDEISAYALRADRAGADDTDHKLTGRYNELPQELWRQCERHGVKRRLERIVTRIRWRRGGAEVTADVSGTSRVESYRARAVVVTVPLGVLQSSRLSFSPRLRAKEKVIARLGWGHAARVVVRFRRGFWSAPFLPRELGTGRGKGFGFVNAPGEGLPVWWALHPPTPILTGWSGGDVAKALAGKTSGVMRRAAVTSLARIFQTTRKEIEAWIVQVWTHPWTSDPFALGAYSFAAAGQEEGPQRLGEPVAGTLFFAGEATSDQLGTVQGALESGHRAAREVLKRFTTP
jgi:monoamine oxidase